DFLLRFGTSGGTRKSLIVGDQGKDRHLTHSALRAYLDSVPLGSGAIHVPDCVDPRLAMAYSFEHLREAVDSATNGHPFGEFVRERLGNLERPAIVGVSIMGPPQVFFALLVAAIAKELWPDVPVVAGGSHITILQRDISSDARYGECFDAFMPHHCERAFADVCIAAVRRQFSTGMPGVLMPGTDRFVAPTSGSFNYTPHFDDADLIPFGGKASTVPLQFTRSCPRDCPYCSYRAAEPPMRGDPQHVCDVDRALDAIKHFYQRGYRTFSFKDSLFLLPAMVALSKGLLARDLRVKWSATTFMLPDIASHADLLCDAGLQTLEFGIESIHPHVQRLIGKSLPATLVQEVATELTDTGIGTVLNLIYGFPTETYADAERQLDWIRQLEERIGGLLTASHNMLEINRGAPYAALRGAQVGIKSTGIAPWAFSYAWNAPSWRTSFKPILSRHLAEELHG
ncbi:MAG: radical SAM protein, partial [Planctomycetes bacterium]|nr:radical SAM protein [Planctomycetota bacterium]